MKDDDVIFTSFVLREDCFNLINSQIRKYKKTQCSICNLDFYPLWDQYGKWLTSPEASLDANNVDVDPLDLNDEFKYFEWKME